jgi:triosephosphate isomerase
MRERIAAANWKMNTTLSEAIVLANALKKGLEDIDGVKVIVCPPSVWLYPIKELYEHRPSNLELGAQNMHYKESGAFTGEISPVMLKDLVEYVILGHSERRHIFGEDDELINDKVISAFSHGLVPIVCVGEKDKKNDEELSKEKLLQDDGILTQVKLALKGISEDKIEDVILAYEPVWAIGTGDNATAKYVDTVTNLMREILVDEYGEKIANSISILYGGSVNGESVSEYSDLDNVDGVLVGGASLKAEQFIKIAQTIAR